MISLPTETWLLAFVSLFSFHLLKTKSLKTNNGFQSGFFKGQVPGVCGENQKVLCVNLLSLHETAFSTWKSNKISLTMLGVRSLKWAIRASLFWGLSRRLHFFTFSRDHLHPLVSQWLWPLLLLSHHLVSDSGHLAFLLIKDGCDYIHLPYQSWVTFLSPDP